MTITDEHGTPFYCATTGEAYGVPDDAAKREAIDAFMRGDISANELRQVYDLPPMGAVPDKPLIDPESGRMAVWRKTYVDVPRAYGMTPVPPCVGHAYEADNDNEPQPVRVLGDWEKVRAQLNSIDPFTGRATLTVVPRSSLPDVVAFTGAAGSGKSTAADYLVREHGYVRVKFAGPLKDMMRAIGLGEAEIEGDLKEKSCAALNGRSPREAMQTLGTEFGRKCMGENFWVNLWRAKASDVLDHGGRVVVDDCRFPNEAAVVRQLGGMVVLLRGRETTVASHESEAGGLLHDVLVMNDMSKETLEDRINAALEYGGAVAA